MSYEKVKSIRIQGDKVMINSACNNVRPLWYQNWECKPISKILQEKGKQEVEIEILKAYEEGNFQGGRNKYTKALKVLRFALAEEYKKFDWRTTKNWEESQKQRPLRESKEFRKLLLKALTTRCNRKWVSLRGNDFIKKITTRYIHYTRDKDKAKKFNFYEEAQQYGTPMEVM